MSTSHDSNAILLCNLEPMGRRRRMTSGWVLAALGILASVALHKTHAAWPLRAAVGLIWFGAATGVLQALRGTCIALAASGIRESATGHAPELDRQRLAATRARAGAIALQAAAIALLLTALGMAWR